jgi:hypothetical protein
MDYEHPQESKDRTLIRIVVAGIGCLFVVAAIVAVLFGKFIFSVRAPNRIVETHLEALNHGNYKQAYEYFDRGFRHDMSLGEFRSQVEEFSSWLPFRDTTLNRIQVVNQKAVVDGVVTGKDGSIFPVHYELSKEKDGWKITDYRWTPPGNTISL